MGRYPRAARDAAVKCISCNAPAVRTVGGDYVCVECGHAVVRGQSKPTEGAVSAFPETVGD